MAFVPKFIRRSAAIMQMPDAIAKGMSANAFLNRLKITTGGYTRTRFLSDWRNVSGTEKRKDAFKFVRRDRRPPMSAIADVDWEMSKEYLYKVRAFVRTSPGEPLTERFVNIPSDRLLSPKEIEEEALERWPGSDSGEGVELDRMQAVAGWHHVDYEIETPSPFTIGE